MCHQALFRVPREGLGTRLWDPYLQKDIKLLEGVQKFALRICSKSCRVFSHTIDNNDLCPHD